MAHIGTGLVIFTFFAMWLENYALASITAVVAFWCLS